MTCQKCGQEFPNKKGRFCGTCHWTHPDFVYGVNTHNLGHKREGKKLGHHLWPNGEAPAQKERTGGFSMTVMEMEELSTYKAAVEVAVKALHLISLGSQNSMSSMKECGCIARKTIEQLSRMGVKI